MSSLRKQKIGKQYSDSHTKTPIIWRLERVFTSLQKVNILICAMCTAHRLISADIRRCFCAKGAELCPWVCQKPELGVEYKRCKNRGGLRPDGIIPLTDAKLGCICQYFQKGGR